MKRMKTQPKRTNVSNTSSTGRRVREKFIPDMETDEGGDQYVSAMPRLEAKNDNQRLALRFLTEGRPIVFLTGSAGSGKSMIAAYHAAKLLKAKKIEKVYLVRPAVVCGKSSGSLPGTIEEKLAPFFAQTLEHLSKFLGEGAMKYMTEKRVIEFKAVEFLRGTSFENCLIICEECQGFTVAELEMMLTRMGEGAQLVLTGDQKQNDLKGYSGLQKTLDLFAFALKEAPNYLEDCDLDQIESGIGVVQFTPDDVVRSGLTRALVKLYYFN